MSERNESKVTVVGNWEVATSTVITEDGATPAITVSDGSESLTSTAPPVDLMVALASHLGVSEWSAGE